MEAEECETQMISLLDHVMRDPCLFGDFRNATNNTESRLYEDLLDYEAVYYLFNEVFKTFCKGFQNFTTTVRVYLDS